MENCKKKAAIEEDRLLVQQNELSQVIYDAIDNLNDDIGQFINYIEDLYNNKIIQSDDC